MQRAIIPQEKPLSIHIATLFDMRIYYKLLQFHLRLPALFFDSLCSVVHLCQTYEIGFDLMHFQEIASTLSAEDRFVFYFILMASIFMDG